MACIRCGEGPARVCVPCASELTDTTPEADLILTIPTDGRPYTIAGRAEPYSGPDFQEEGIDLADFLVDHLPTTTLCYLYLALTDHLQASEMTQTLRKAKDRLETWDWDRISNLLREAGRA